jgi:hypothetical protein
LKLPYSFTGRTEAGTAGKSDMTGTGFHSESAGKPQSDGSMISIGLFSCAGMAQILLFFTAPLDYNEPYKTF